MDLNKNTIETKRAIVYLRVSTEEQVENFSLDTQERICLQEAQRKGMEVIQIFREEGRSAKNITGRPVLIEMLEFFRKHKKQLMHSSFIDLIDFLDLHRIIWQLEESWLNAKSLLFPPQSRQAIAQQKDLLRQCWQVLLRWITT